MKSTTKRRGALLGLAAAAVLVFAACSSNNTADTASSPASPAAAADTAMVPFGSACSAVPTTGAGSFNGMATVPVATAASNNPVLSTLVTAVTEAGLGDTLNSADGITVFAPSNDAFAAVPKATLNSLMADPTGSLSTVLTYHVVSGKLTPEMLAGTHKTLEGSNLTISGSGEDFTVNDSAKVICGDVQTSNATVYIIDGVLTPPAS